MCKKVDDDDDGYLSLDDSSVTLGGRATRTWHDTTRHERKGHAMCTRMRDRAVTICRFSTNLLRLDDDDDGGGPNEARL